MDLGLQNKSQPHHIVPQTLVVGQIGTAGFPSVAVDEYGYEDIEQVKDGEEHESGVIAME
jgi:hypothetical protein